MTELLGLLGFNFFQEFYCGGNLRHFIQQNGESALVSLIDLEMPDPETTHGESLWNSGVRYKAFLFSVC